MSAVQNTRLLLPRCVQAGVSLDGATAGTVENALEWGRGLLRSQKKLVAAFFCSGACAGKWEFALVLSRHFLARI